MPIADSTLDTARVPAPRVCPMLRIVVLALVRQACPSHRGNVAATLRDLSWHPEAVLRLLLQPTSKN